METTAATLRHLRKYRDSPKRPEHVFVWVHYIDPHAPYYPPRAIAEAFTPGYEGRYRHNFGDVKGGIGNHAYPKDLGKERTIILSTHNLPEVMATCTRMIIINDGVLVADGTPAELQSSEEENPRVRIVVRGPTRDELLEAFGDVEGVASVEAAATSQQDAASVDIIAEPDTDVRPAIFKHVVDKGWELLELRRLVLDLEGIFRKLTEVQ